MSKSVVVSILAFYEVPKDELLVLHKFKTEDIDNVLNNLNNVIQKIKANRHLYEKSGGVSINQLLDDNVQSDQPATQISPRLSFLSIKSVVFAKKINSFCEDYEMMLKSDTNRQILF